MNALQKNNKWILCWAILVLREIVGYGRVILLMLLLTMVVGCSESDPFERAIVAGKVSYAGKPVEFGMIRFIPTGKTQTPPNAGYIQSGEYEIKTRGGVTVGTHRVEILAYNTEGGKQANAGPMDVRSTKASGSGHQYLPEKYNKRTELSIEIRPDSDSLNKNWELEF